MKIYEVEPETLHLAMPLIEKWAASKHGMHTVAEVIENLTSGNWTLWAVVDGPQVVAIYAVHIYDSIKGRCLEMPFICGSRAREWWRLADAEIEQIAQEYGAQHIVLTGRRGWERMTRGRYAARHVVLTREVGR